ncbi:MAG: hypothetical protein H6697_08130 [Myxococcales bacterium]|nr:hypothetical protein [Myxococcales bacterium]
MTGRDDVDVRVLADTDDALDAADDAAASEVGPAEAAPDAPDAGWDEGGADADTRDADEIPLDATVGDAADVPVDAPAGDGDAEPDPTTDVDGELSDGRDDLDVPSDLPTEIDVSWEPSCVPEPPFPYVEGVWPQRAFTPTPAGGQDVCGPGFRVEFPAEALVPTSGLFAAIVTLSLPVEGYVAETSRVYVGFSERRWPVRPDYPARVTLVPFVPVDEPATQRGVVTVYDRRSGYRSYDYPLDWEDGIATFLVPGDVMVLPEGGSMSLFLGSPPTAHCGNHILEDGEQCDGGVGCSYCHFNEPTCRPDTGCPPMDCFSEVLGGPQIDCSPTPVGPCEVSRCDSRSLECVAWPTFEGEPCVDGATHGWCRGGVCDPTPEECALCELGYRWVDGGCEPEEVGATYVAGRAYSAVWSGLDSDVPSPGGGHWGYYVYNGEPYVGFGGTLGPILGGRDIGIISVAPVVGVGTGAASAVEVGHSVEYYARRWTPDVDLTYSMLDSALPWSEELGVRRIGVASWLPTGGAIVAQNSDADPATGGSILATRVRIAEHDLGVCEVAVNVDGEWQTCPERPGATICAGQCVDTRQNLLHCGECGHACGDAEICTGGECVCDPRLARLDLPTCAWDACPDGWYGPGCRSACPGILEGEPECYGRGECSDGPFGTGICMCTGGHHGADCMYSCSDGVRNGSEVNVDCGGLRCAPCR